MLIPSNADGEFPVFLIVAFLVATASPLHADTLPFASLEFPPYNYRTNGRVTGFTTDVVRHAVREMGHTPTVELLPWQRAQNQAARGEYAGVFTFTKSVERMRNFRYTAPVARIKDVFFKRRNDTITWREMRDLSSYEIGASPYNYADVFLKAMENGTLSVQVVHSETPELLHLRKLKHRRIDLAICELRLCQFLLEKHSPAFRKIDYLERPVGPVRTFHVGISRAWPNSRELTRAFNRQLVRMSSNGTLRSLREKHFSGVDVHQPPEDFLRHLAQDLRMYARSHPLPESNRDQAEELTNRLKQTVNADVQTLGWERGKTLVAWVRRGHVRVRSSGTPQPLLAPSEHPGLARKEGPFRLVLLTEDEVSSPKELFLAFEASGDQSSAGGYLLFKKSGVVHQSSTGLTEGRRTLRLDGLDNP